MLLQIFLIAEIRFCLKLLLFKGSDLVLPACVFVALKPLDITHRIFSGLLSLMRTLNTGIVFFILRYFLMHKALCFHHRPALSCRYGIFSLWLLKNLIGLKLIGGLPGLLIEVAHQLVLLTLR